MDALAILRDTARALPSISDATARPARCLGIYFQSGRNASLDLSARWKDGAPDATTTFDAIDGALAGSNATFHDLFRWFRDREDFENAEKVRLASFAWVDPQLDAVRAAVTALLPGFTGLRVDRAALRMVVDKDGSPLFLDQLSDGERNLIALSADVARRLAIANPGRPDPLHAEVIVLIDEIELHLHPGLQREVLPRLRATFPNAQFVVSTHSPQVLSSVSGSDVRVLEHFEVRPLQRETWRRDTNRILEAVFGDPGRPPEVAVLLNALRSAVDHDDHEQARAKVRELHALIGSDDPDVFFYENLIPPEGGEAAAK